MCFRIRNMGTLIPFRIRSSLDEVTQYFMSYYVYILKCADDTYYTGITNDLARRISEHQNGVNPNAYTFSRRPVEFVWGEEVATYGEALNHERQIKKWSQAKKEALIHGDFEAIHKIVTDERKRKEAKKKG